MKIEIKCRFSGKALFEHDAENNTMRLTLEAAVKAGAYLDGAYLDGAYLDGANLDGAYLTGANLTGANLTGANLTGAYLTGAYLTGAYLTGANLDGAYLDGAYLTGANLTGANLDGAYLDGAYLTGANLTGAYLDGAYLTGANLIGAYLTGAYLQDKSKLVGERPILQIGPIGSRCSYFVAYLTDRGIRLRSGCFFGTKSEFEAKLSATHKGSDHAKEYRAALAMIDAHAEIWTPAVTKNSKDKKGLQNE